MRVDQRSSDSARVCLGKRGGYAKSEDPANYVTPQRLLAVNNPTIVYARIAPCCEPTVF